jgi:hypothetical protein
MGRPSDEVIQEWFSQGHPWRLVFRNFLQNRGSQNPKKNPKSWVSFSYPGRASLVEQSGGEIGYRGNAIAPTHLTLADSLGRIQRLESRGAVYVPELSLRYNMDEFSRSTPLQDYGFPFSEVQFIRTAPPDTHTALDRWGDPLFKVPPRTAKMLRRIMAPCM